MNILQKLKQLKKLKGNQFFKLEEPIMYIHYFSEKRSFYQDNDNDGNDVSDFDKIKMDSDRECDVDK